MKQKSRLQLKRNLALLLVLSMLFGLSTAAYATEEAGLPEASAAGEVVSDEAYQAEEVLPEAEVTTDTASDEAMNAEDVMKTCACAPDSLVIASHMEAVSHAHLSRKQLREALAGSPYAGQVRIPEDGESIAI